MDKSQYLHCEIVRWTSLYFEGHAIICPVSISDGAQWEKGYETIEEAAHYADEELKVLKPVGEGDYRVAVRKALFVSGFDNGYDVVKDFMLCMGFDENVCGRFSSNALNAVVPHRGPEMISTDRVTNVPHPIQAASAKRLIDDYVDLSHDKHVYFQYGNGCVPGNLLSLHIGDEEKIQLKIEMRLFAFEKPYSITVENWDAKFLDSFRGFWSLFHDSLEQIETQVVYVPTYEEYSNSQQSDRVRWSNGVPIYESDRIDFERFQNGFPLLI